MVDYLAEKINSMGPPYWDTPKTAAAGPPRAWILGYFSTEEGERA